jgi:hypothetical protein
VQAAWLRALADLNNCSRAAVLREALTYLAARESARVSRTRYYRAIALAAAASRWDPISDYLAGRPVSPPDSALDNQCYVKLARRLSQAVGLCADHTYLPWIKGTTPS